MITFISYWVVQVAAHISFCFAKLDLRGRGAPRLAHMSGSSVKANMHACFTFETIMCNLKKGYTW